MYVIQSPDSKEIHRLILILFPNPEIPNTDLAAPETLLSIKLPNQIFWLPAISAEPAIMKKILTASGLNQLILNGKKGLIPNREYNARTAI